MSIELLAEPVEAWTRHDTMLITYSVLSIALLVFLISKFKLHPMLGLTIVSLTLGLVAGLGSSQTVKSFLHGAGATFGDVGLLIGFGAILGVLLSESGGANRIVSTLVGPSGTRMLPWTMTLVAIVIGIPLFFEVGLVMMMPVIFAVWRKSGGSILRTGVPVLAGLSVLHALVPPHPGPLAAVASLNADLGQTLLYGLIVAVPTAIIAGPVYGNFIARRISPTPPPEFIPDLDKTDAEIKAGPSFAATLGTLLLPLILMLSKTIVELTGLGSGTTAVTGFTNFVGTPTVAMLIAVLVAMVTFGRHLSFAKDGFSDLINRALAPIAGIVMIIAAGGGFKDILLDSGVGDAIAKSASAWDISPLILAWLIAVAIRCATGSATVATVTAAGIMVPIAAQADDVNLALVALAVGSGSLLVSHLNNSGFWMVKEYFGMTVGQTLKSWSVVETIASLVSITCILGLSLVV
ncbi:GntT/GntP/DsdX family permease [Rhodococcus sp. NPDC055112]